ncbi:MAG: primosomal protein N' [Thermodesulfobacteriota bacterium]
MADPATTTLTVALAHPVQETYDYEVPDRYVPSARVGCRVLVPIRNRVVTGYILESAKRPRREGLKPILEVLDPEPLFHEGLVHFFRWMADYYLYPIGRLIQAALPGGLNVSTYQTAALTPKGLRAADLIRTRSGEGMALDWIKANPGKKLPAAFRRYLPSLRNRGWVTSELMSTRRRARLLSRTFVRVREGVCLDSFLREHGSAFRAEGEAELLSSFLPSGTLPLHEISRRFPNGDYLLRKWMRKGILERYTAPVMRDLAGNILFPSPVPPRLFEQQDKALHAIQGQMQKGHFSVFLLHGVTGSGKTEVYFGAIRSALDMGRQAILLVPEIALAVYMEGVFRSRLGNHRVAVYHSNLTEGERFEQWMRMARGEVDLVIGARSALFAPFPGLGLIIVDEEHDPSYKQEEAPRYQGRDSAVARGKIERTVVLLGSGTPSVQSYHNALTGRYRLLSMPERVERKPLPVIRVVDMKTLPGGDKTYDMLSPALREALQRNLEAGKQAMLFLNRRGFHRVHLCRFCGTSLRCPNCDLALIHHLRETLLACHYCGFHTGPPRLCPACGKEGIRAFGFGTERLEQELRGLYPGARTARMDRDTAGRKGETYRILKRFGEGELDILVGTQMITKGYDFPNVTLVGVISADSSLAFPDFRSAERTFQLLSQVAGRAGRGVQRGDVIIQSLNPDHYAVTAAQSHDYPAFFERERELRAQLGYPPYSYMACLRFRGNGAQETADTARRVGSRMTEVLARWPRKGKEIQVLGPAEAPLLKLKGKYRWQILVKCRGASLLHYYLKEVEGLSRGILRGSGVSLTIDVDPYQML